MNNYFINYMIEFLVLGVVLVIGMIVLISRRNQKRRLLKEGVKTTGLVRKFESVYRGSTNAEITIAIIEFETKNGNLIVVEKMNVKKYRIGQRVDVVYNENDPEDFILS
ncbi:DUF3592 domain-containing protein [Carboxylicivirga mesophila]|uniref:DUF3592 domain-containing protein n=1 Tax=Carboxylicivirga mesophila TaxID=1166478 RepID=A0ABS5KCR1_9BACT|nr:DUF3592 domain-containing protein [Carboxylicivirga mesophila]MBS2212756.1 DUF3592 domain-containing protein [Carboxylicivirga mesophila]